MSALHGSFCLLFVFSTSLFKQNSMLLFWNQKPWIRSDCFSFSQELRVLHLDLEVPLMVVRVVMELSTRLRTILEVQMFTVPSADPSFLEVQLNKAKVEVQYALSPLSVL